MKLTGTDHYNTANRILLSVRDAVGVRSKYLTIKQYCNYEGLDFTEIWCILRSVPYDGP